MRAVHFDGRRDQRVAVPAWVSFRPVELGVLVCVCANCSATERVELNPRDAQRQMGRFALWHRRCGELPLYEEAQRQQAYLRQRRERGEVVGRPEPAPITFVRRKVRPCPSPR